MHPKLALLFELNVLPLRWVKIMRMGENSLLKQVMMDPEVMELETSAMEFREGKSWK